MIHWPIAEKGELPLTIIELIQQKYPTMTKKQRVLADYMLASPESMSFMTMKELSSQTGVSEMTILHACTALGLANYNELKYEFRKYLSESSQVQVQQQNEYKNLSVPDYELSDKQKLMAQICEEEFALQRLLAASLDINDLFRGAEMMLDASNTIFCARGVSMQVADFLSMRLAILGLPSVVVNTELADSIQAALPLFNSSVLAVPISLPDYHFMTTKVTEFARQRHARILCLTDSTRQSGTVLHADLVLAAPVNSRLYLNTPAPMMTLANLLSSALNVEKSARKTTRFSTPDEFSKMFTNSSGGY